MKIGPRNLLVVACATSAVLLPAAIHFWGPLIGIALSPAIVAFCVMGPSLRTAITAWSTGCVASFLIQHTLWIINVNAVAILSVYQAITWIPVALGVAAVWRRWRIPLTICWPIAWTAGEALRAMGPLGTIFGILPVPRTTELWMLQIADLGGYGMATLPLAMVQGWFADLLLSLKVHGKSRRIPIRFNLSSNRGFVTASALLAITWVSVAAYGHWRLRSIQDELLVGPTVAVIDPDIVASLEGDFAVDPYEILKTLKALTQLAVDSGSDPDLVVWPEGMVTQTVPSQSFYSAPFDPRMNALLSRPDEGSPTDAVLRDRWTAVSRSASEHAHSFREWVSRLGVPVLVGTEAWVRSQPDRNKPFDRYNAAIPFHPNSGQCQSFQAKARLYPLGESAPWKNTPLEPILNSLIGPPHQEYAVGKTRHRYTIGANGPSYVISLCSELKFSSLKGQLADISKAHKPFDLMINMANESLFHHNRMGEIFAFCATLRAIENRVAVVRSSNAGISGFYDPTGRPYGSITHKTTSDQSDSRSGPGAWSVQPVYTSETQTLFQRIGDWLSPTLIFGLILMNLSALVSKTGSLSHVSSKPHSDKSQPFDGLERIEPADLN